MVEDKEGGSGFYRLTLSPRATGDETHIEREKIVEH